MTTPAPAGARTVPAVAVATTAWAVAVGAGVAESALAVTRAATHEGLRTGDWANIALRVTVYTLATVLVVAFAQGRRWARYALTGLLTVLGLASLVVPAALAVAGGQTVAEALSDGGRLGWQFVAVRATHIVAVVLASVVMYTPPANRYFARPTGASSS